MATALSALRTRLRYRLLDTESASYQHATSVIDAWINAGIAAIAREVPYGQTSGPLTGINGTLYYFDLAAIFTITPFHRLRAITPVKVGARPLRRHSQGMDYIRRLIVNSQIIAGTPTHYGVQETTLFLNAIPASGEVYTVDYYFWPALLSDPAHTPAGLLKDGWDRLILAAASIEAGEDIQNDLGKLMVAENTPVFERLIEKFRRFVVDDLGRFADTDSAPLQELNDRAGGGGRLPVDWFDYPPIR